jgi:hypothetical protein
MELDPLYVDTALRRWQKHTGKLAGAIHFIYMDWRHLPEILAAGRSTPSSRTCASGPRTTPAWALYRSQHQFVLACVN